MLTTIKAVALRTVRHNDRTSILTAWSERHGRLSLIMPAGSGKEGMRRRALTMPLGLFEGVVNLRERDELLHVRDLKGWGPDGIHPDVSSTPVRGAVAMFVAEVLNVTTRESAADAALWSLIVETVVHIAYGRAQALANVPSAFLIRLATVLGIAPDTGEWREGMGFDMTEGVFRGTPGMKNEWVDSRETAVLMKYARAAEQYRHIGLARLPEETRTALTEKLLRYYTLHQYGLEKLKTVGVLGTVLGGI